MVEPDIRLKMERGIIQKTKLLAGLAARKYIRADLVDAIIAATLVADFAQRQKAVAA